MLESGNGMAECAFGDVYVEPNPRIELCNVGKFWHVGKVMCEKRWLSPPAIRSPASALRSDLGRKSSGYLRVHNCCGRGNSPRGVNHVARRGGE